jgi:hypothetical protein
VCPVPAAILLNGDATLINIDHREMPLDLHTRSLRASRIILPPCRRNRLGQVISQRDP